MIYIVMGVSGSGKSTVAKALSAALEIPFYDADDFHPPANIEKMRNGNPLNDHDRRPWLDAIAKAMASWHSQGDAILACSALKVDYRLRIEKSNMPCQWVFLKGSESLLAQRLKGRQNHFFNIDLLKSQLDTLEEPSNAWEFNIELSVEEIVAAIIEYKDHTLLKQDIGVIGLGVMGQNLVLNFAENGTSVAAFNRHVPETEVDVAKKFVAAHQEFSNIIPFDEIEPFVASLSQPRNILIMVQAGAAVDAVIEQLAPFLDAGDSIIDGGNSLYLDTVRREKALLKSDIDFVGMGVSGGEKGARFGPSMMPGGSPRAVTRNLEFFNKVAAKDKNGLPCCTHIGEGGAGHFVKMIHNGIEYAEMQLIAECYDLLQNLCGFDHEKTAKVFQTWQNGDQESYLLGITIEILKAKNGGKYMLDSVQDYASHKGTGSWSVRAGLDLGESADSIASALSARQYSSSRSLRHKLSKMYNTSERALISDSDGLIADLEKGYRSARLINHIIGFEIIKAASARWEWRINMPQLARIWTNGCIIRSQLMVDCISILEDESTQHLLLNKEVHARLSSNEAALSATVSVASTHRIAIPTLSSCNTYYTAMTTGNSGANVIAAQRDYFGAHGFLHVEDPSGELHHWSWSQAE